MDKLYQIHQKDNVIVSLINDKSHKQGHKYALKDINKGDSIIKYGSAIGHANTDIKAGDHVHTHNTVTNLDDIISYSYSPVYDFNSPSHLSLETADAQVSVYERYNGEVGIRNELWIIPTVACVNGVSNKIIDSFKDKLREKDLKLKDLHYCDGIYSFTHPYGCSQMGDDLTNTIETLQNIVKHPNAGGVLLLGLGCENNQIDTFMDTLGDYDKSRFRYLNAQDSEDEIEDSCKLLEELFINMQSDKRVEKPISCLNIGLECGGSDGLSGITANPLVGLFSDYLIANGATTVLTEVPEMFGAEQQLMNRCINESVYKKTVAMINDFKKYYQEHNLVIYDNPSPGNKKGGITTLEDKSLGCITKSGNSPVIDVLKSNDRLQESGLNLISAPGNDAVATTTLGTCGCHMVLFTTGRGTPFGGFIPTVKIATNHELATKKKKWIDFDAGRLILGEDIETLLEEFTSLIIRTANGSYTRQEENNYREIAIFKSGVTL